MRKSAKNRIIVWSVISAVLIGVLVVGLVFSSTFAINSKWLMPKLNIDYSSYLSGNAEFTAADVKSLDINWTSGNIKIEQSDSNKIEISETSTSNITEEKKMRYKLDSEGKLTVNGFIADSFWFSFGDGIKKTLTLKVPDNKSFNDISISTASADVEANKLKADKISTETASGRVTLKNVDGKSFSSDTASGDIKLTGSITDSIDVNVISAQCNIDSNCEKLDVSSVSGNVDANLGNNANDIDIETVSGVINLTFPENISGIKASHSSVSGAFLCEFDGNSKGETFTSGNGSIKIDMETVSGSMNILKAE